MVLRMEPYEHSVRTAQSNWSGFQFPKGAVMPARPWHKTDNDSAFRGVPKTKAPNSDEIIEHLKNTGKLNVGTGDVVPGWGGHTSGVLLNEARPDDRQYTISRQNGPRNLCVTTGYSSSYGAKVRIGSHMAPQGYPMNEYSDHKLHVYDPTNNTITEIQFLVDVKRNPFLTWLLNLARRFGVGSGGGGYQCHGVTQYDLDVSSTEARGRSVAKMPIAETTLRVDDVLNGSTFMTSMSVTREAAHMNEVVSPAKESDGLSLAPNAIRIGMILRLKPEKAEALSSDFQTGDQALHMAKCWAEEGIMVIDTGGHHSTSLEPDIRWDQVDLQTMVSKVSLDDFEVWLP